MRVILRLAASSSEDVRDLTVIGYNNMIHHSEMYYNNRYLLSEVALGTLKRSTALVLFCTMPADRKPKEHAHPHYTALKS